MKTVKETEEDVIPGNTIRLNVRHLRIWHVLTVKRSLLMGAWL